MAPLKLDSAEQAHSMRPSALQGDGAVQAALDRLQQLSAEGHKLLPAQVRLSLKPELKSVEMAAVIHLANMDTLAAAHLL